MWSLEADIAGFWGHADRHNRPRFAGTQQDRARARLLVANRGSGEATGRVG
jgi:hypothetical protein